MRQILSPTRCSRTLLAPLALWVACAGDAHAALQGRDVDGVAANGYEAYYDTVLNLTWLADANYAKTMGVDAVGAMSWDRSMAWVNTLDFYGVAGWRLPSFGPVNGVSIQAASTVDGSTDASYNISSTKNELAYMYYTNLGLAAPVSPSWEFRATFGVSPTGVQPIPGLPGGQIKNLASNMYWTNVTFAPEPERAWGFWTKDYASGYQGPDAKYYSHYAWAVHDGDPFKPAGSIDIPSPPTAAVDEPATAWLMLAGLGVSTFLMRRRSGVMRQAPALV